MAEQRLVGDIGHVHAIQKQSAPGITIAFSHWVD
jgi:hypothetical protein